MAKNSSTFTSLPVLGLTLALAALGQAFLAQWDKPWTLYLAALLYLPALFLWVRSAGKTPAGPKVPPRWEAFFLGTILLLALFLRVYRLDYFPAGIFQDEACVGFGALRILHEGWRPFYELFHTRVPIISPYYLMALWLHFVSVTKEHFFLFSALLSVLSFPLVYWTFRQLTGPTTALLSLFLLAVMRWDILYSRDAHPAVELPLYMFGTLAFWLYGTRKGKLWSLVVAGLFFGAGFYGYQAYKAFVLLMIAYAAYEFFTAEQRVKPGAKGLAAFFLPAALVSCPIWTYWLAQRSLGHREAELFLLNAGGWCDLPRHFLRTALMFNREGDGWFFHNLPNHRMLDDGMGVLWLLGLVLALKTWKKREHFYALLGLAVMVLPTALSVDATHASRAFGAVPFLALLAGMGSANLGERVQQAEIKKALWVPALSLLLIFITAQNTWTYFREEAGNSDCWRMAGTDATAVGTVMQQIAPKMDIYLAPSFQGHYSVLFLGYFQRNQIKDWAPYKGLYLGPTQKNHSALFALPEGQTGQLALLKGLYPGGYEETLRDPWGNPLVHFYRLIPEQVAWHLKRGAGLKPTQGLRATYYLTPDLSGPPVRTGVDPLINFTFRGDLPLDFTTLSAKWEGTLNLERPGAYQFVALSSDHPTLYIDGKLLFDQSNASTEVALTQGKHRLSLLFKKASGENTALTLAWKKPGDRDFEVVPYTALSH